MAQQQGQIEKVEPEDPQFTLQDHILYKRKQQILSKTLKQLFQSSVSQLQLLMDGTTYAHTKLSASNKGLKQVNQQIWEYPHLRKIDFSFNRLSNINSFIKLKFVSNLDLSRNILQDIKFLSDQLIFPYAKIINLSGNKVISLPSINLRNLRSLNLSNNLINTLQQFEGHQRLQVLQLRGNKIKTLNGLKKLNNLRELYIAQNALENLNGIDNAPNLIKIHARKNKIAKFLQFPKINVKYLNLRQNLVAKIDDIALIGESVQNLNLLANPLSEQMGDNVKKQIYMRYRHYEKVNKVEITAEQKQEFDKQYKDRLAEIQKQRLEREAAQREAAQQAAQEAQ